MRDFDILPQHDITLYDQLIDKLKAYIEQERQSLPILSEIQDVIAQLETRNSEMDETIQTLKEKAMHCRQQIDDLKQMFNENPESYDESIARQLINDLSDIEKQIGNHLTNHWKTKCKLEIARQKMEALNAGVYDKPIDEDPRLVSLIAARDRVVTKIMLENHS